VLWVARFVEAGHHLLAVGEVNSAQTTASVRRSWWWFSRRPFESWSSPLVTARVGQCRLPHSTPAIEIFG
jgi:hypothetical protein